MPVFGQKALCHPPVGQDHRFGAQTDEFSAGDMKGQHTHHAAFGNQEVNRHRVFESSTPFLGTAEQGIHKAKPEVKWPAPRRRSLSGPIEKLFQAGRRISDILFNQLLIIQVIALGEDNR